MLHGFHSGSPIYEITDASLWPNGGETAAVFLFQAYMDTLQTQWSWILQITKCIDVHLKENAAYFQVFIPSNHLIVFWVSTASLPNVFEKALKTVFTLWRENYLLVFSLEEHRLVTNHSSSLLLSDKLIYFLLKFFPLTTYQIGS